MQGETTHWQPAAPLDRITVRRVIAAVREGGDSSAVTLEALERLGLAKVLSHHNAATHEVANRTLTEIIRASGEGRD